MKRDKYDALVAALDREDVPAPRAHAILAAQGISPDSWEPMDEYTETCDIYGAGQADIRQLAEHYGWDDPGAISHAAINRCPGRDIVVLQEHYDNIPSVEVYVYRTDLDVSPLCWTLDSPGVRSTL
jgi:hypothetical protein